MYSAKELIEIIPELHIPKNNLWCYTGFTLKQIQNDYYKSKLLSFCNVLIDGKFELDPRVIQHEPLGVHDYNCLQMNACAVVSDSGTL